MKKITTTSSKATSTKITPAKARKAAEEQTAFIVGSEAGKALNLSTADVEAMPTEERNALATEIATNGKGDVPPGIGENSAEASNAAGVAEETTQALANPTAGEKEMIADLNAEEEAELAENQKEFHATEDTDADPRQAAEDRAAAESIAQLEEEEAGEEEAPAKGADQDPGVLPDAEKRAEEKEAERAAKETPAEPAKGATSGDAEKAGEETEEKKSSRNYEYQKKIKAMTSPMRFVEYTKLPQERCDVLLEESANWSSEDKETQAKIEEARNMVAWAKDLLRLAGELAGPLPKEIAVKKAKGAAGGSKTTTKAPSDNWKAGDILRVRKSESIRAQYAGFLTAEELEHLVFIDLRGPAAAVKTKAGKEIYPPKNHLSLASDK